jgi:hypothetical protein
MTKLKENQPYFKKNIPKIKRKKKFNSTTFTVRRTLCDVVQTFLAKMRDKISPEK